MSATVILFIGIILIFLINRCRRPEGYPPGPPLLPFIGSWYCLPPICVGRDVAVWRKEYGNIIGHRIGFGKNLVIITGFEEIVAGLKHPNLQNRVSTDFQKARSFNQKLEQWAKMRALTFRYFGQVYSKLPEMVYQELEFLFSTIKSGAVTEINEKFMKLSLNIVCSLMVGSMRNRFPDEIEKIAELTNKAFIENRVTAIETLFYPQLRRFFNYKSLPEASEYMHNKFIKICLEEHKKTFNPSCIRDYIDVFLFEAEKEKKLGTNFYTDEELSACMIDLLQASSESIGNTLSFVLLYVVLNPQTQDKLHEELDRVLGTDAVPQLTDKSRLPYCQAVIYETMRINPISPLGVAHVVTADTEFYGYLLPKDTIVFFAHDDMMNDPELWQEPEKFKPERFLNPKMKGKLTNFGLGKRSCIGEILVKNIMLLFVARFFQKYKIKLPIGYENPCTEPRLGITNGVYPFKLIISDRKDYE